MKLVIIIGAHAVGKMTVGQELEKISDLKLFHNHMAIEPALKFFSYSTPEGRRLVNDIREAFFRAFLASDAAGYIFTFVWAFGEAGEREYVKGITQAFEDQGAQVTWIELIAPLDIRLARNKTPNRMAHKPSKQDLSFSEPNMIEADAKFRLVSDKGEIDHPRYLRIETADLSAMDVATQINAALQD